MTVYTVQEARNVAWHDRTNGDVDPEKLSAALQTLDAEVERLREELKATQELLALKTQANSDAQEQLAAYDKWASDKAGGMAR